MFTEEDLDILGDPSKILNSVYPVLACCGGLLTIDEEESTVRVVHHSVKQFLSQRTVDDYFHLANRTMADDNFLDDPDSSPVRFGE